MLTLVLELSKTTSKSQFQVKTYKKNNNYSYKKSYNTIHLKPAKASEPPSTPRNLKSNHDSVLSNYQEIHESSYLCAGPTNPHALGLVSNQPASTSGLLVPWQPVQEALTLCNH